MKSNVERGVVSLIKSTSLYFGLVFGTGFLLGSIRVLFLVPKVGDRGAELIEAPVMAAVILGVAKFITGRISIDRADRVICGVVAMLIVLLADLIVGVTLRNQTPQAVFLDRDPVTGGVYYGLLILFALAPAFVGVTRSREALMKSEVA